ncbi:AMP-binding protein [Pseudomonas putida]|uniref:AMP-binding protein n=1 Tax=Pseudomonas putida TaxID=303 RepID=UPI0018ABFF5A|nr:AMP-binding protein [Pseudomonas putida]MBF8668352.1 AMP-binding protein [Pseudomonas putida]MBF8710829.1 AMP-binding protein [Pseudomonas putida]
MMNTPMPCQEKLTTSLKPIFAREFWTLKAVLELQAVKNSASPFLQWTHENEPLSFSEVNSVSNRHANGFLKLGIEKGDRVVLFQENSLSHAFCWFGCAKIGAVDAPINATFKGAFLAHQMNLCAARYAIVDADLVERLVEIQDDLLHLETLIVVGDLQAAQALKATIKVLSLEEVISANVENPSIQVAISDPATIQFTSGTTGPSKGVLMPNGSLHLNAEQTILLHNITQQDTFMSPFPLFHGSGRQTSVYPMLLAGGLCVLYPKFSGTRFLDRAKASGATITMFHGSMLQMIAQQTPSEADRAHRLRSALCIPLPYTLKAGFEERFGIALKEIIGMTETSITIMPPPGVEPPKGYAGCLISDFYDARVADPQTDEEVPDGVMGELQIRPKMPWSIMLGYENMPAETIAATTNLWFHTGDGVIRSPEGWFGFVDRIKDSIRRRGENISSFEVEYQLLKHPAVSECAIVGVRLDKEIKDEEVKAFIVLRSGMTVDEQSIVAWCEELLPLFAVPRFIEFIDSLPKTPTGKTQKHKLRHDPINKRVWDRLAVKSDN